MRISAEAAFILDCVRTPEPGGTTSPSSQTDAVQNWESLVELAERHRVAAFLLDALRERGMPIPGDVAARLVSAAARARGHAMRLEAMLLRVASAMRAAGIPILVLKGPALSTTLYTSASLRPYDDLDLTVREQDESAAVTVLSRCGFAEVHDEREDAWLRRAGDLVGGSAFHRRFVDPSGQILIELHTDPLQLGLSPVCEPQRWRRALTLPTMPGCLTLCPEDLLIQLSVHAHKHGFSRLIWLKDIDLLLRSAGSAFDWDLVARTARQEGVCGSIWYSLWLTGELLHTPVPAAELRRLRPAPWVRWLYSVAWPCIRVAALDGQMRRRAVQLCGADSWRGTLPSLLWMGRRGARARMSLNLTLAVLRPRAWPLPLDGLHAGR